MKKFVTIALLVVSLCIVGCGDKKTTGTSGPSGTAATKVQ